MVVIKRRIRPRLRRILGGALLSVAVLWLVAVTASSATAESALQELSRQNTAALSILRRQLGSSGEEGVPVSLHLIIGQSPALLASREAVLELRRTVEAGLILEALKVFIDYLSKNTVYETLFFMINHQNLSSKRIMEKLGSKPNIHSVSSSSFEYQIKSTQ